QEADRIVAIEGEKNPSWDDITLKEIASAYHPLHITVERNGSRFDTTVTPILDDRIGVGSAGWFEKGEIQVGRLSPGMPAEKAGLKKGDLMLSVNGQAINSRFKLQEFLKGIIERRMSAKQLQGPIGIAQLSGEAAREGPSAFVHLMSMVSLNLAIFNLLPIPILDGGVILLLLVEMLLGRDLSMPVKEAVIKVGFVFLMVVTVFALYNDISKILPAG